MCGIACIISKEDSLPQGLIKSFPQFVDAVAHRGPDDRGIYYLDSNLVQYSEAPPFAKIAIGHRRLSILDLTSAGRQPMLSNKQDYIISYNGEIYNYIELRNELEKEGFIFNSHCDTEVLLTSYIKWSTDCFKRLNGMWAFVIVDKPRRKIVVSRDRIGIKPLYYLETDTYLAFASEIKQFFCIPDLKKECNEESLLLYLFSGYENPPKTFYKNIFSFEQSSFVEIDIDNPTLTGIRKYWSFPSVQNCNNQNEITEKVKFLFRSAIQRHMRSDVPVGLCLSGGIDSSSILMNMRKYSSDISAFSACFEKEKFDESYFVNLLVRKSGVKHYKVSPTETDLKSSFENLLYTHDEPFGSVSIFAQYMVMKKAKECQVPVLLDGQGGDELLSRYLNSYMLYLSRALKINKLSFGRHIFCSLTPFGNYKIFFEALNSFKQYQNRKILSSHLFEFKLDSIEILNNNKLRKWHEKAQTLSLEEYRKEEILTIHLPRLLKWEDRNSMAFSIESRVPFLDLDFMELALSIPPEKNLRNDWTKFLFRKAMNDILPYEICWRRDKIGFETPQDRWMRNGSFYAYLLDWTLEKEHPILVYINANFANIRLKLQEGDFDSNSLFRLFCADKWLKLI